MCTFKNEYKTLDVLMKGVKVKGFFQLHLCTHRHTHLLFEKILLMLFIFESVSLSVSVLNKTLQMDCCDVQRTGLNEQGIRC